MVENGSQFVARMALRNEKGKTNKNLNFWYNLLYQYITLLVNTIVTSTYQLNSGRKWKLSCYKSGIQKEKGKIHKI